MSPTNNKIVCHCLGVTEGDVRSVVASGSVQSIRCIMNGTGAGTGCTACQRRINDLLCEDCPQSPSAQPAACVAR